MYDILGVSGKTTIHEDKSSESLPLPKRPMFSTNYSDAFKYLIMRKDWLKAADKSTSSIGTGGVDII